MRNVNIVLTVGALLLGGAAFADTGRIGDSDREFIEKAAMGGMAEVKLGRLAVERAQSSTVKDFGRRMIDDHTRVNRNLQQVAAKKGVTVPSRLSPEDQALYDRLSRLSGAEFDRAYLDAMAKDHDQDVAEFKKQANEAQDPELKAFARGALPTLEEHDDLAHRALGRTGASEARPMKSGEMPQQRRPLPPEQETPHQPGR
ncbi:MAG TPA: DUF4142 domain-containing protein [Polyangia bacterium]|nr:DUF4142 domain-containing protein [Polyangia bacterium]